MLITSSMYFINYLFVPRSLATRITVFRGLIVTYFDAIEEFTLLFVWNTLTVSLTVYAVRQLLQMTPFRGSIVTR